MSDFIDSKIDLTVATLSLTKSQLALLKKALADAEGIVRPFGGEWNSAYKLHKGQFLNVIIDHHGQRYRITDAARHALASLT